MSSIENNNFVPDNQETLERKELSNIVTSGLTELMWDYEKNRVADESYKLQSAWIADLFQAHLWKKEIV